MRILTTPRWVYVMLIVMGIGFAAGAVPFWLFVPVSGHFVAVVWLLMGFGFVFFSMRALASRRDDERLRRDGLRATATLVSANATGWMINNVPQWALKLRIDGAGPSYETTMKLTTFNPPANGASFAVRVDPQKKQHVVLASDADDAPPVRSTLAGIKPDWPVTAPPGATVIDARGTEVGNAVLDALRRAGIVDGTASANGGAPETINPDGSRTITSSSVTAGGARSDAAETVKLLAQLDQMHASGTIGDAEFETLKRKLLGEA
ncbi:MAG TPA: SHOCT domain-containing protein [Candidatus Limnocylindrales bacterium]|nr:SHOCT domain-containing protein [Candidatus Limnocylindrales bacterium]